MTYCEAKLNSNGGKRLLFSDYSEEETYQTVLYKIMAPR
jgi:hypothetical protein